MRIEYVVFSALVVVACEAKEGAKNEPKNDDATPSCTEVTVTFDGFSGLVDYLTIGGTLAPAQGGAGEDLVTVQAFGGVTGTFELDEIPNDSWVGCYQCVVGIVDGWPAEGGKAYFQTSGTFTVEETAPDGTYYYARSKGSLTDVTLREVTVSDEGVATQVEGGGCMHIASAAWDTSAVGPACDAPVDLGSVPSGGACGDEVPGTCNPITSVPCNVGEGEGCEYSGEEGVYKCYPAPNDVALCGACNNPTGPWCAPGMTCDGGTGTGTCYRYCCDNSDCGTGAICVPFQFSVGVCMDEVD